MKAYIQTDKQGEFYNVNAYIAHVGFKSLGFEVIKFHELNDIDDLEANPIIVGGISNVRGRLTQLGIPLTNQEIDYPDELKKYFGRKIWTSNLYDIFHDDSQRNIFIKPKKTKAFTGKVVKNFKDFIGLNVDPSVELWCSEVIPITTEWRCFVRYQELLDVRYYKGAWDSRLDIKIVQQAIKDFSSAPAAYCLDFGVDKMGNHFIIEVNDGHSLGTYGIGAISYAKFLSARWSEMTNTTDYLRF